MKNFLLVVIVLGSLITSCTVNSHVMLKTPKDFVFDEIPTEQNLEYVISEGDQLDFRLYSNGGFAVIDIASGANGGSRSSSNQRGISLSYLVEPSGKVELPIVGEIYMKGMTIREGQDHLEELYSDFYVDPFLQLTVNNKRVIVFSGTGSNASVVTLQNNTVTLLEVLAQVGGISNNSKAKSIKLMREVEGKKKREVYLIDLSKIEGLEEGDLVIQANDIIYVEPNANIAREILQDVTPVLSLITTSILFYATIRNLSGQ